MSEELSLIQLSVRAPAVSMRDVLVIVFRQRRLLLISFVVTFFAVLLYGLTILLLGIPTIIQQRPQQLRLSC